jgi:branched-chain amino acid transport system ATP-binding protein
MVELGRNDSAPQPSRLSGAGISVGFGGIQALSDVTIELLQGAILGVIGPNGAGKTTLVNVLTGFQRATHGEVLVDGRPLGGYAAIHAVRAGIARTFQAARLFHTLTVAENIEVGLCASGLGRRAAAAQAAKILEWTGLRPRANTRAGALPFGEERLVGIARALGSKPRFLLLDEPAAGLNEVECRHLSDLILRIPRDFGCGLLLIEHNMDVVMGTCPRLQVLDRGRTIALGLTAEVSRDPQVIAAYLGLGSELGDA